MGGAKWRIGTVERPVRAVDKILQAVESFALIAIGQYSDVAARFDADHTPGTMLIDREAALAVEREPVRVWLMILATNAAPLSKLRGITELKHAELPEIFVRLPLPLHLPFDGLPVCPFPYRGPIVPVGPNLPTTQNPLHRWLSAKSLARRDTLEDRHSLAWRHFRICTAKQMDVILVCPNGVHLDRKPFRDLGSRLPDNRRDLLIEQ